MRSAEKEESIGRQDRWSMTVIPLIWAPAQRARNAVVAALGLEGR